MLHAEREFSSLPGWGDSDTPSSCDHEGEDSSGDAFQVVLGEPQHISSEEAIAVDSLAESMATSRYDHSEAGSAGNIPVGDWGDSDTPSSSSSPPDISQQRAPTSILPSQDMNSNHTYEGNWGTSDTPSTSEDDESVSPSNAEQVGVQLNSPFPFNSSSSSTENQNSQSSYETSNAENVRREENSEQSASDSFIETEVTTEKVDRGETALLVAFSSC